jgi:hypothetical protein
MRRHAVITRIGDDKSKVIVTSDVQVQTELIFLNDQLPAEKRVTHERLFKEIQNLGLQPTDVAMDLLILAVSLFAADTRVSRKDNSQDGWTREIDLYVPVGDQALWDSQKPLLEDMLRFLTGDLWRFIFRPRPKDIATIAPEKRQARSYETDTVCLFSGGLDSFIGAIDLLESGTRPILLGHYKSSDVASPQRGCAEYLQSRYEGKRPDYLGAYINVPKKLFGDRDEKTERGRSFLFFSLGIVCASALGNKARLVVPENGLISLNVPLTPLRLGAPSTRTTHPYFVSSFQKLLGNLGINVLFENPYQFKTKGEMLKDCRNQDILIKFAHKTMSCAHPSAGRWAGGTFQHCGHCVPCIIRRAAFKAAYGKDATKYGTNLYKRPLSSELSEGEQVQAFKVALARLRKNPEISDLVVYKSGPLQGDASRIALYADLYRRGMAEVESLLDKVRTTR